MNYSLTSLTRTGAVLSALFLAVFLSLSSLTESPPTWMDEGIISQVALNVSSSGIYGIQVAPQSYVPAGFVTTSYPLIYPLAAAFNLGGASLLSARLTMVFFIFLLIAAAYLLIQRESPKGSFLPIFSLFLLVSFAPLYGHGKNVIGEVPGLAFLVLSLLVLTFRGERKYFSLTIFLSGLSAGFAMATKPIYLILILPAALFSVLLYRPKVLFLREKLLWACAAVIPIIAWFFIHFSGDSFLELMLAGNPDSAGILSLIRENGARFFTEAQPFYALAISALWCLSLIVRRKLAQNISRVEVFAFTISLIDLVAYLGTRGFYRYFFPAQVLGLIYLPLALFSLRVWLREKRISIPSSMLYGALSLLVLFQCYQTFFHSWISLSSQSSRASLLSSYLQTVSSEQSIFLYHVPEAVLFLPTPHYYQYLRFADSVQRGNENIPLLIQGIPDFVLVDQKFPIEKIPLTEYSILSTFDKYTLYEKK